MADFNYVANVKCVNGNESWVEVYFPNYIGVVEDDITAISFTGPSGLITNDKADLDFYENLKYIIYRSVGTPPELGTYTFSVTIGGETLEKTDEQTIIRTLPIVDNNVSTPAPGASSTTDTTFTWEAVSDPGFDVYYGIQIVDESDNYIANMRYIGDFQYAINLVPGNYSWQVIVMDGIDWSNTNNRTHGNWSSFTII